MYRFHRGRRSSFALAIGALSAVNGLDRVARGASYAPLSLAPLSYNANTIVNNANGTITGGNPADLDPQASQTYYSSAFNAVNPFPVNSTFTSPTGSNAVFRAPAAGVNNTLLVNSHSGSNQYNTPQSSSGTIYLATPMALTNNLAFLCSGVYYGDRGAFGGGDFVPMNCTVNFTDGSTYQTPGTFSYAYDNSGGQIAAGIANTQSASLVSNSSGSNQRYTLAEYDTGVDGYPDKTPYYQKKVASITFTPKLSDPYGTYTGDQEFVLYAVSGTATTSTLAYTGGTSNNWDSTTGNFTPGTFNNSSQVNVVFSDAATGSTSVNIPSAVTPGSVSFNNSTKAYVISGAAIGDSSSGPTGIGVSGGGTVTFNNSNTYTGPTNVNAGNLIIGSTGSIASNSLVVSPGATLSVLAGGTLTNSSTGVVLGGTIAIAAHGASPVMVLQASTLSLSGASGSWTGKMDLGNNDLLVHNGSIGTITNQVAQGYAGGTWNASGGITSSSAAANPGHITALGVIINDTTANTTGTNSGTAMYATLDGANTSDGDVLVKYTYYGDANLDGQVSSADYTLIDGAYLNNQNSSSPQLTGWFNGDFNYDGVINGSDYTLIDNAFNSQGSNLGGGRNPGSGPSVEIAAQIAIGPATSAVPEPAALGLLSAVVLGALSRRSRGNPRTA